MPFLVLALVLLALVAPVVLMPLSIVLRYRAGTARRLARGWAAMINIVAIGTSAALLLTAALVTNLWVPRAFVYTLGGLAVGGLLGLAGLRLSLWEATPLSLHYTPNRWLVLALTVVVTSRMAFGVWRAWHAWRVTPGDESWLAASGVAGSLAAGAVVLGYYLLYSAGVWRRFRHHRRAAA
jgi:hypothetical protein